MSVYKEGYRALEIIQNAGSRIYDDACDFGALTNKGDTIWNNMKQLVEWYGEKGTRKFHKYETGFTVVQTVKLMDEWSVSDGHKTIGQATELYKVTYVNSKLGIKVRRSRYDGYVYIEKIEQVTNCCGCAKQVEDPNPKNKNGLVLCGDCDEKGIWIDPAGGIHQPNEADPAAMYE